LKKIEEVKIVKPALGAGYTGKSPQTGATTAVGTIIGLILGLVFAFIIETFDTSMGRLKRLKNFLAFLSWE